MNDERNARAERLLAEGNYPEAGALFHQLWDETGDPGCASRYVRCLRKAGHARGAVTRAREAREKHPDDLWIQRELVWAYYEAFAKPAERRADLNGLLDAAQGILDLDPEPLPRQLVVFAVIRLAKKKGKWDTVCDWCDRLDPAQLDNSPREINGKVAKSQREEWYFDKVKSLVKLKRWPDAQNLALQAADLYRNEPNFRRWAATARAEQGDLPGGIGEMEQLVLEYRGVWYLLHDLSEMYLRQGNLQAALRFGCRAALTCSDDTVKVSLYHLLSRLDLALGKLDFAAQHAALVGAIRRQKRWSIPAELTRLETEIREALHQINEVWPVDTDDVATLVQFCREQWLGEVYAGLPRKRGTIESLPPDQAHGWIKSDDGERVFVLQKDLPPTARQTGLVVDFALEPSWDRKRQQPSVRAVDLRLASG
jgi:tetratricopeptide (TPR) repeat protein